MRKLLVILALTTSIIAVILSVLPLSNLAFIPAILAFIFGLLAFFKSRKENTSKHTIQLVFLFTIIALSLATYKSIFSTTEVGDTEQLEQRVEESLEDSIEELEDIEITE